jgi:polyisoprenoid-binding protein YceI
MKAHLGVACVTASFMLATAVAADQVDTAKSSISFVSTQMGVPVEGRFTKFSARVSYDPKTPAASKAEIEVALGSVDTGSSEADAEVVKKPWFNVAAFPAAKFVATAVKPLAPGRLEVKGTLSIKGISRDLVFPMTVTPAGATTAFEGTFPILRLQYKIGEGAWSDTETVADEVRVRFRILITR